MNCNSFLKVELRQEYDISQQRYVEERNIKVSTQSLQHGLIKDIGVTEFTILCVISSFCDVEGEAFPSQRTIADITGLSLPTVNKAIGNLLETKIDGVPILSRELESLGSRKRFSVYKLFVKPDEDVKKKKTARDFVLYFKDQFENKYKFPYLVNYARDGSLFKKKLMVDFTEDEIIKIIDYAIEHYTEKWGNERFTHPTISMLSGWLGNAVVKELLKEQQQEQVLNDRIQQATNNMTSSARVDDVLDL